MFDEQSVEYAGGRISALQSKILDKAKWSRLFACTYDEGIRLLTEWGYGKGSTAPAEMAASELSEAIQTVRELSPRPALTDLLLLENDAHNIKVALKARLTGADASDLLSSDGCFSAELIALCVSYEDFSALGQVLADALDGVFEITDPQLLSFTVDKAVFAQIISVLTDNPDEVLIKYFAAFMAYTNFMTVKRGERLGLDAVRIKGMMLPADGLLSDSIPSPALRCTGDDDYSVSERKMREALSDILQDASIESLSLAPLYAYTEAKKREARNIRVLFASKKAGIPVNEDEF